MAPPEPSREITTSMRTAILVFTIAALLLAGGALAILRSRHNGAPLVIPGCTGKPHPLRGEPMIVVIDAGDLAEWGGPTQEAIAWWNRQDGRELFRYGGARADFELMGADDKRLRALTLPDPLVVLASDSALHCSLISGCHSREKVLATVCTIRRVGIFTPNDVPIEVRPRFVAHELGHARGLFHDPDEHSVMYPRALAEIFNLPTEARAYIDGEL